MSLSKLFDLKNFLSQNWPDKPFVARGVVADDLNDIAFLKSLEALLSQWPRLVQAHLPDVADESSSIDVTPADARKLFANRLALLFNNVETQSPTLVHWLETIRSELGLPNSTYARCLVYATPDGKGTAPHFDQNINFVLQLQGTKIWWLAPNESVENPLERFTIGQPIEPEIASYAHDEMPTQMPDSQTKVVLEPGSLLFVPRGYWHRTEASGEALALNFTLSQPTYLDLFLMALRSRLVLSPEWRALADGVNSERANERTVATEKFDQLLMDLTDDLPNWRAADILAATEGHD